jgi:membrane protease YdiL (CAAX protease family)
MILISQIPGILLGIFPILYITTNKHSFEKLGFRKNTKQFFLSLIIGLSGGIVLIILNTISSFFTNLLYDIGINLFDIQEYIEMESKIIKSAGIWIFILIIELILTAISVEIVFRGVLHNTLIGKFGSDNINGKLLTIVIVALAYSGIYLLFSFPIGIYFLIPNFLSFLLLGFLYEINKNIFNTIIASIFYNITLVIVIFYF